MKSLTIPVHSFIDVITNSSSEIFISADEGTVKAVKELINNLLKGVGSDKTSDDLFDIVVGIEVENPETYEERKISGKGYTITVPVDSEEGRAQEEANEEALGDGEYGNDLNIIVTPKEGTNENIALAAKTLGNLTGLFSMEAYRNG